LPASDENAEIQIIEDEIIPSASGDEDDMIDTEEVDYASEISNAIKESKNQALSPESTTTPKAAVFALAATALIVLLLAGSVVASSLIYARYKYPTKHHRRRHHQHHHHHHLTAEFKFSTSPSVLLGFRPAPLPPSCSLKSSSSASANNRKDPPRLLESSSEDSTNFRKEISAR
jgi:hypothetical protein